ncbi:MAG: hypothetical protein ACXAC5_04330 [Promethearchaeota archaeon]|jgi:hypothetical protein
MESLKKDILWIFVITVAVVAMVFAAIVGSEKLKWSNDGRVISQFVYEQLNICNEKLAAYGEDVEFDIPKHKATAEDLNICIEKLGAYGEDNKIPVTSE